MAVVGRRYMCSGALLPDELVQVEGKAGGPHVGGQVEELQNESLLWRGVSSCGYNRATARHTHTRQPTQHNRPGPCMMDSGWQAGCE